MKTIKTSCGRLNFTDQGKVLLNVETVRTIFKLAVELKNNYREMRHLTFIRFGTSENIKMANWIWCLLFEHLIDCNGSNALSFYFLPGHPTDPNRSYRYGRVIMRHDESPEDFSIPLNCLGRKAQFHVGRIAKLLKWSYLTRIPGHGKLGSYSDVQALDAIGGSKLAPRWATHNPFVSFPNFIPMSVKVCPTFADPKRSSKAREMSHWAYGRGEFCEDPNSLTPLELAQWQEASELYYEKQAELSEADLHA